MEKNHVELFALQTLEKVSNSTLLFSLFRLLLISRFSNLCAYISPVMLTASPDFSILATDVETGRTIARLENAHE